MRKNVYPQPWHEPVKKAIDRVSAMEAYSRLLTEQSACWQRSLPFPRPQGCIRAARELLAQARRPVEAEQALAGLID
jgi:hypothetical protein